MNLYSLHPYYLTVYFLLLKHVCKHETFKFYNWEKKIDTKCHTKGKKCYNGFFWMSKCLFFWVCDAPPNSLKDSNACLKVKTMEEEGVGVCSLTCNISRGGGKKGMLELQDGDYDE